MVSRQFEVAGVLILFLVSMDIVKQAGSTQRLSQFKDLGLQTEKAEKIEIIKSPEDRDVLIIAHDGSKAMVASRR